MTASIHVHQDPWFWSYVKTGDEGDCWPWLGHVDRYGYGKLRRSGKTYPASAYALSRAKGWAHEGAHALHSCDNPICCNPDHLRWGSPKDNMQDKIARGRAKNGVLVGAENPRCKISIEQLGIIVARLHDGWNNQKIASDLPVSAGQVSRIRTGRSWVKDATELGWGQ